MKFIETLKLALSAIWAHKLRSALTLLGMIIGVTAVVTVVSVIQGFNAYFDEKVAGIGSQSFSIRRFSFDDFKNLDTIAAAQRRNKDLTLDEFEYLRQRTQLIDRLGARANATRSQIKRGSQILEDVPVDGATANMADIDNLDIADGRFFTDSENDAQARVAYIGTDVANNLFPSGNAVGNEITIAGLPYRVIGVQTAKGTVFGVPQDNFITIPLKTYATNFGNLINQRSLYMVATAKPGVKFNDAVEEARFLMRTRRHLAAGDKDNFGILTPDAITGIRDRVLGTVSIVAIAVPSIALVVGGIVIMNIMLVSVTERTKEIGIRKSLGARRSDILKQFMVEAVTLSAIGGATGVLLAWLIGRIITATFFPTYLSIAAVITAVSVSGIIGVLSGIFPAWKAARLDPIEALRAD
ncbi:MAG: putative transport system permease protein [Acidobacteriota bacterium]|nr:putative transport system permease protein [Acidobacteriota bacterium]